MTEVCVLGYMELAQAVAPIVNLNPFIPHGIVFPRVYGRFMVATENTGFDFDKLMNRVKSERCESSFKIIFDHFYGKILSFFKQSGIETQKASELAQETLLAIWHKSDLFDSSKGSFNVWIFTIARNLKYDHFRTGGKESLNINADDIYDQVEGLSIQSQRESEDLELQQQVDLLPPEQKEVIQATYFEGYTHSQFAEKNKIPLGTVKSRIRLALNQLKKDWRKND